MKRPTTRPRAGLRELQRWMRRLLELRGQDTFDPSSAAARRQAREIERQVLPSATLAPAQRFDIYSRMVTFRLVQALEADFPSVAFALRRGEGGSPWARLAHEYVRKCPSRSQNLNDFSRRFPDFVSQQKNLDHAGFLGDLARVEWAMTQTVFDRTPRAPDLSALAHLGARDWESVTFVAAPTLHLFECSYPVNEYIQSIREGKNPRIPRRRASWVAVFRKDFTVWRVALSRPQYLLLSAIQRGRTLRAAVHEVLASKCIDSPSLQAAIEPWFREWMAEGFFERILPPAAGRKLQKSAMFQGGSRRAARAPRTPGTRYGSETRMPVRREAAAAEAGRAVTPSRARRRR
jgi:hypothetical protein